MAFVKVLPGQSIGQNGRTFQDGEVLEVPAAQVNDIKHLALPCTPNGEPLVDVGQVDDDLAKARKHERVSILEAEQKRLQAALNSVESQLAAERADAAKTAPTPAKATPSAAAPKK